MRDRVTEPYLLGLVQLAAFWPLAHGYVQRTAQGGDASWGLLALTTACVFLWRQRPRDEWPASLTAPCWSLVLFAAAGPFLSEPARLALAATALTLLASACWLGTPLHLGLWGLALLALPLLPEWQATLSVPLCRLMGMVCTPLLHLAGVAVDRIDTALHWRGEVVLIDVVCSGVRKLWTGLYLACTLACFLRLTTWATCVLLAATIPAVLAANTMRVAALFYLEVAVRNFLPWHHDVIGAATFGLAAAVIVVLARRCEHARQGTVTTSPPARMASAGNTGCAE